VEQDEHTADDDYLKITEYIWRWQRGAHKSTVHCGNDVEQDEHTGDDVYLNVTENI
jgi:hypothetical protein